MFSDEAGSVKAVFTLVILIALVLIGLPIAMGWSEHGKLEVEVKDLTRQGLLGEVVDLKQAVSNAARNYTAEVAPEDVEVSLAEDGESIEVGFSYDRLFDFKVRQYPYRMSIDVRIEKSRAKSIQDNVKKSLDESMKKMQERTEKGIQQQ